MAPHMDSCTAVKKKGVRSKKSSLKIDVHWLEKRKEEEADANIRAQLENARRRIIELKNKQLEYSIKRQQVEKRRQHFQDLQVAKIPSAIVRPNSR